MTPPALQSPKSVAFADLWYQTRETLGVPIPAKSDLPLRGLAPFMSQIALIEHTPSGRARYVLFGTGLAKSFGRDMTGDYVEGPMTDEARAQLDASRAAFAAEHGADAIFGRWTLGTAQTNTGRLVEFENLTFPYIEPSNNTTRFMSFVLPLTSLEYGEGISKRFPDKVVKMFNAEGPRPDWIALDPEICPKE